MQQFQAQKGDVLETYDAVSKGSDAKTPQGDVNYYPDVIYNKSNYIYWMTTTLQEQTGVQQLSGITFTDVTAVSNVSLSNGSDGSAATTTAAEINCLSEISRR